MQALVYIFYTYENINEGKGVSSSLYLLSLVHSIYVLPSECVSWACLVPAFPRFLSLSKLTYPIYLEILISPSVTPFKSFMLS